MKIDNIQPGMTWGDIIPILNQLINQMNALDTIFGKILESGKFDYSFIENKPTINGHVLEKNMSTESLDIFVDQKVTDNAIAIADNQVSAFLKTTEAAKIDSDFSTLPQIDLSKPLDKVVFCVNDEFNKPVNITMKDLVSYVSKNIK